MKRNSTLKTMMVPLWTMLITFLFTLPVYAQNIQKAIGRVLSANNQPIAGANIKIKGTATGTITDIQGNFALPAQKGDVLVVSFLSYQSKEIAIGDNLSIGNVLLQENSTALQEVVVVSIGYGTASHSTKGKQGFYVPINILNYSRDMAMYR